MTRLPDHLILENILPRLPVRSLFRFKSVCKDWLYAISSHDFAKSHLKYSSCRPHKFLLLANDYEGYNYVFNLLSYKYQGCLRPRATTDVGTGPPFLVTVLQAFIDEIKYKFRTIIYLCIHIWGFIFPCRTGPPFVLRRPAYNELQHDLKPVILPLDIDNGVDGVIDIVGSCDGLVCLYHELNQHRTFYIWNPAIQQCREIDQIVELEEIEPFMFTAAHGFGHGSSTDDDYKIVAIFTSYTNDFNTHLYVYSSVSRKWRRITCILDNYRVSTIGIHKGALIGNTVYWPLRIREQGDQENRIVGFNLRDDQLEVNPWMNWLLQGSESNNLPLFGIQGCLSLCRYVENNTCFDVWMLKDRNDWNSWEKLFFVNVGYVDFIHFSKNGKCLVHHLKELKVVDQGQDGTQCRQGDDIILGGHYDGHLWDVEDYTESFVSPF